MSACWESLAGLITWFGRSARTVGSTPVYRAPDIGDRCDAYPLSKGAFAQLRLNTDQTHKSRALASITFYLAGYDSGLILFQQSFRSVDEEIIAYSRRGVPAKQGDTCRHALVGHSDRLLHSVCG